jgi:SAM-dependent methyltransferase
MSGWGSYDEDLAHIHASGHTMLAEAAGRAIVGWLQEAGIDDGLVVELGCGTGVTARALLAAGYDVLGIDASAPMLRLARRTAPAGSYRRASLLDADLPRCAAVLAVGEVLNYTDRSLDPVFRRIRRALEPRGMFVCDLVGPGRAPRGADRLWAQGDDWAILVEITANSARSVLTRRMTTFRRTRQGWRRGEETHRQRLHPPAELARRLRGHGFRVRIRRGYEGRRFAPGHYVLVARAP